MVSTNGQSWQTIPHSKQFLSQQNTKSKYYFNQHVYSVCVCAYINMCFDKYFLNRELCNLFNYLHIFGIHFVFMAVLLKLCCVNKSLQNNKSQRCLVHVIIKVTLRLLLRIKIKGWKSKYFIKAQKFWDHQEK